ncbi:cbb3-type cytochrome c oxidase N-terminal domain-containing protein [Algoriphagus sp.]|uniref:cbb3-type cytochrome c oxidase N-terminal domain-containing protein n=1 Tax=Algoriphagus sp. TaxID=1872435 RepID=UPI002626B244|nr:cbb3-type cytochrome c oxidase N-terminal domain-containing protein [Algoriphagus sp.]
MKKLLFLTVIVSSLSANAVWAQSESSTWYTDLQAMDSSQLTLLIILAIVLGVILLLLVLMVYLMSFMQAIIRKENPEAAQQPSWWEKFKERFVTGKMDAVGGLEERKKMMSDHSYDGITELDNFMPPWLQWVFTLSTVFAILYFVHYSVLGTGKTGIEEYEEELRIEAIVAEQRQENMASSIDEENVTFDSSEEAFSIGKSIFEVNCAACHANDGGGGVGPNLTDEYWIHGGSIQSIFSVIKYGVVSKGMVPWEDQLTPLEIQQVSSYIMRLKGTAPANPKEPQGELYAPEENSSEPEEVTEGTSEAVSL